MVYVAITVGVTVTVLSYPRSEEAGGGAGTAVVVVDTEPGAAVEPGTDVDAETGVPRIWLATWGS